MPIESPMAILALNRYLSYTGMARSKPGIFVQLPAMHNICNIGQTFGFSYVFGHLSSLHSGNSTVSPEITSIPLNCRTNSPCKVQLKGYICRRTVPCTVQSVEPYMTNGRNTGESSATQGVHRATESDEPRRRPGSGRIRAGCLAHLICSNRNNEVTGRRNQHCIQRTQQHARYLRNLVRRTRRQTRRLTFTWIAPDRK